MVACDDVDGGRNDGYHVARDQRQLEHLLDGPGDHEGDGSRPENGAQHDGHLVPDVEVADVRVHRHGDLGAREQVHDVGQRRRHPAPALVEELVEALWGVRVGVGPGNVVDPVTLLQQQCAQPPVLTCTTTKKKKKDLPLGNE